MESVEDENPLLAAGGQHRTSSCYMDTLLGDEGGSSRVLARN